MCGQTHLQFVWHECEIQVRKRSCGVIFRFMLVRVFDTYFYQICSILNIKRYLEVCGPQSTCWELPLFLITHHVSSPLVHFRQSPAPNTATDDLIITNKAAEVGQARRKQVWHDPLVHSEAILCLQTNHRAFQKKKKHPIVKSKAFRRQLPQRMQAPTLADLAGRRTMDHGNWDICHTFCCCCASQRRNKHAPHPCRPFGQCIGEPRRLKPKHLGKPGRVPRGLTVSASLMRSTWWF